MRYPLLPLVAVFILGHLNSEVVFWEAGSYELLTIPGAGMVPVVLMVEPGSRGPPSRGLVKSIIFPNVVRY